VYSEGEDRSAVLRSCYRESLRVAGELGARSIAFPLISAGAYRWPVRQALEIAIGELRAAQHPGEPGSARLVLWQPRTLELAQDVLAAASGSAPGTA
jgi:O-acetyl-ADP-ribose deacetylase